MFTEDFQNRILAFDAETAKHYADIVVMREQVGRPISMADAQTAAICLNHDATLATRNIKNFEALDIKLFNPWLAAHEL
ncbi:hypothetical protein BH10PSE19_BH10PSE19_14200 [soil metagenome]